MPVKSHNNFKNQRLEGELRSELASIIRDIKDPRIPEFPTVTRVEVSSDRTYATVFVSFLGEYEEKTVRQGLKSAKGFIRKKLGERMQLRVVPDLSFVLDTSIATGARIDRLISEFEYHQFEDDKDGE